MIHVVVRSITVGNIFHCQSCDELDDAGITRLEHPVDLLILLFELLNKLVNNDLYGIKHCSLHSTNALRAGAKKQGFAASSTYRSRRAQSHRNNRAPAFPAPDVTSAVAAENAAGGNSPRDKARTTFNAYPLRMTRLLFGMLPVL